MRILYCFCLLSVLVISEVFSVFTKIIEIGQGRLRGLRSVSGQSRYYGIPYAKSWRFRPPQEPQQWDGIFNAINPFTSCAQTVSYLTLGVEDCLQLDVYTPEDTSHDSKLPVIMFIHGGGYYYGSKYQYDPEFLVTKNTVAVIINYRLGVLGFLCINEVANLGLKDQVAALKWIKKNISAFGGDPDNVTICGQSAGASSATMHFLSPSSKGLFHKAIILSGSPLAPWAFNVEPSLPAFEDARKLGEVTTAEDVITTFNETGVRNLLNATRDTSRNTRYFKYTPCVEMNSSDPFFPDSPYEILKSGNYNKVPTIIGFTNSEGMLFYGLHNDRTFKDLDENFLEKLPSVFSWCSEKDRVNISGKFRKYYFESGPINAEKIKGVVDYYSDWVAYSSVDAFSRLLTNTSDQPVYSYIFSYEGGRNFAKMLLGSRTGLDGASHSDDIFYIFKPGGISLILSNADKLFIDRLTGMLANFMRTGDPTPSTTKLLPVRWKPTQSNNSVVFWLSNKMTLTPMPRRFKGEFMMQLLCAYGAKGFVPCESKELCDRRANDTDVT